MERHCYDNSVAGARVKQACCKGSAVCCRRGGAAEKLQNNREEGIEMSHDNDRIPAEPDITQQIMAKYARLTPENQALVRDRLDALTDNQYSDPAQALRRREAS